MLLTQDGVRTEVGPPHPGALPCARNQWIGRFAWPVSPWPTAGVGVNHSAGCGRPCCVFVCGCCNQNSFDTAWTRLGKWESGQPSAGTSGDVVGGDGVRRHRGGSQTHGCVTLPLVHVSRLSLRLPYNQQHKMSASRSRGQESRAVRKERSVGGFWWTLQLFLLRGSPHSSHVLNWAFRKHLWGPYFVDFILRN